eukprot:gene11678-4913_t
MSEEEYSNLEKMISKLANIKTHEFNNKEINQRIKQSKNHIQRYIFECKTTIPQENNENENPIEIIKYYTSKLFSSKTKEEFSYFLHQRGCVYFDNFEYELCENDFKESLKYNPKNPILLLDYSDLLCVFLDFQKSIDCCLESIKYDPTIPISYVALAESYCALDEYDLAIEYSKKSLSIDPYYLAGYYELGFIYYHRIKDPKKALIYLNAAVDISKKISIIKDKKLISTAYRIRANIYFDEFDYSEGMKNLEMGLYYLPSDPEIWFEKGYRHYIYQEYQEAIESFTISIQRVSVDKSDSLKWKYYFRGLSNIVVQHFDDALNDLTIAIDYDDTQARFYYYIGSLYSKQGLYLEATKYYDIAVNLDSNLISDSVELCWERMEVDL